jgi:UDP-N-acetylglucosamine 2-epimerase (non-hydrolysing)
MNRASNNIVMYPTRQVDVDVQDCGEFAPGGVLHAVGSRSEAVRLATVVSALREQGVPQAVARVIASDDPPGDVYDARGIPCTEALVASVAESDSERTARVLAAAEQTLLEYRPRMVVLTGDADATLAFALAAAKLGIEIARVGAGLRTGDFSQSEEINRMLGDRLADVLFTDDREAGDVLEAEGIAHGRVVHVGNSAIDLLRRCERAAGEAATWRRLGVPAGRYVLVTLHRSENVRDEIQMARIADALVALAKRGPVVMPVHPVTRAMVEPFGTVERLESAGVRICNPLSYVEFISVQQNAGAILTDSGGVQDEASALGVRCYTLRRTTERVLTLSHGTNVLLGENPQEIAEVRLDDRPAAPAAIPLWDGRAGERIAAELNRRLTLELAS